MNHDETHRTIVRSEVELALQKYLPRDVADAMERIGESASIPPPRAFSTDGGTMAIGGGCFLIRPPKVPQHERGISSPARDEVEAAVVGADAPSDIAESDFNGRTEEEIVQTTFATAAAEDKVTAVLTDPQLPVAASDATNSTASSRTPPDVTSNTAMHEGDQTVADSDRSTTDTADDGAGPPPRIGPLPTATALHGEGAPSDTSSTEKPLEDNDNQEIDAQLAVSASRISADKDVIGESNGQSKDTLAPQAVAESTKENSSNGDAVTAEAEAVAGAQPGMSTVGTVVTSRTSGRTSFAINDADYSTEDKSRESRASHEEAAIVVVDGSDRQVETGITTVRDVAEERTEDTIASSSVSSAINAGEESKMGLTVDGCGGVEPDAKQDPSLQRRDEASDESSSNPALRGLLRDMTCAVESIAAAAKRPFKRGQQPGATTVTSGCTAVVFLDAPLITPGLQPRRRFAKKKGLEISAIPADGSSLPDEAVRRKPSVLQSAAVSTDVTTAAAAATAVAEFKRGSGDFNVDTYPAAEVAVTVEPPDDDDKHSDGSGSSDEEHPAGLGDPSEALEALLSWIGEGGCSVGGHREVLLICCGGDGPWDNEKGDRNANGVEHQPGSADDDPGGAVKDQEKSKNEESVRSHVDHARQDLLDDGRIGKISEHKAVGRSSEEASKLPNNSDGGSDGDRFSGGDGYGNNIPSSSEDETEDDGPRGVIRQIVLGGRIPVPISPQQRVQGLPISNDAEDGANVKRRSRDEGDSMKRKVPTAVDRMRRTKNNGRNPPSPIAPSTPTGLTPPPLRLPPSEVLLQTRTVPNCEGLSRLAVAFPPPSPGTTPAVDQPQEGNENPSSEETIAGHRVAPHEIVPHAENVRVLVGPVIGRVGPTSAVVLVEVSAKCPVAAQRAAAAARQRQGLTDAEKTPPEDGVGVRLVDTLTSESREMFGGRRTGGQPGVGPRVFEFEGLTPGRRYTLRLLGVRQHDQVGVCEAFRFGCACTNCRSVPRTYVTRAF